MPKTKITGRVVICKCDSCDTPFKHTSGKKASCPVCKHPHK